MSPLGPEARRLIAATKTADDPSLADRVSMRARLDGSWAVAAKTPVAIKGLALGTKLIVGAAVVGLGGLGVLQLTAAKTDVTAKPVHRPAVTVEARAPEPSPPSLSEPVPVAEPRVTPPVRSSEPAPVRVHTRTARPVVRPAEIAHAAPPIAAAPPEPATVPQPSAAVAPPPAPATPKPVQRKPSAPELPQVDNELALLGAAQDALQSGKPSLSLKLVQQHAFRFPRGALDRERLTVEALALCALQRKAAAHQVLRELARRAPESPVLGRIRSDCGFEED